MIVDEVFKEMVIENSPQMNPLVMKGISTFTMPLAETYLSMVFRSAAKSLPKGMEFVGIESYTPEEDFLIQTKDKNNRRGFNIAESSVVTVKFVFRFKGEIIERPITLPFTNEYGLFHISGTEYHFIPVISDKVISPGFNDIFVRLLRDKLIFLSRYHSVCINENGETSNVVYGDIYRNKNKRDKRVAITTRAHTCVVHYLLAKYGFDETFRRFAGFVPVVGHNEINRENYPEDKWVICSSTQIQPHGWIANGPNGSPYINKCSIRLAIPVEYWNSMTKSLVYGFYYVADHFPTLVTKEFLNNTSRWKILIGHIVFSGAYGFDKLFQSINDHVSTLDDYIDPMSADKLRELGMEVGDFYGLLALIVQNFSPMVMDRAKHQLSMFGKTLETLYYIFFDLTSGFFKAIYKLNRTAAERELTRRHVEDAFNKFFKAGTIFKLTSGRIFVSTMSTSVDHSYPKCTAMAVPQEANTGGRRTTRGRLSVGDAQHAHGSMLQTGSILFLSKSDPSPIRHLNPYVQIEPNTMTFIRHSDPELNKITDTVQAKLKGRVREHP